MISKRLKTLFLLSLIPIYLHGIEEVLFGFQYSDSFMISGANLFNTTPETFYWITHIFLWWLLLPVAYMLFQKSRLALYLMTAFSLVFIFEFHHIFKALLSMSYYPGMITALVYPLVGIFFWKELVTNWRKNYGRN